jgi:aryl-alcohol dehydrogenase-like predicted oxidoreductase
MRYVRLGKTDLLVSTIGFGTWAFGGDWGSFDPRDATAAIHRALDLGLTLFDTAQAYGFGVSERLLGDALWKRVRRDEVIVATKGGLRKDGETLVRDASARWLREGAEASLRNLRTDYVDLYQVHWPDPRTPVEGTARVLEDLVREGKVRHVGVSNYDVPQMDALARHGRVETLQPAYHMFRRDIEPAVLPYAAEQDIGVLVYGPLAHGLLGGHMSAQTTFAADDWRSHSSDFSGDTFQRNLRVLERLREWADGRSVTLPELAVAWTISHPAVHVALVGARRAAQLVETVSAAELRLSDADRAEIAHILADAVPVTGPSPEGM